MKLVFDRSLIKTIFLFVCFLHRIFIFRGNNALHIAVKEGHLDVIRVLLTESHIDAKAINFKGRNPLHILANFAQDNAVAVFDLFLECMPDFPLDKIDGDGNTGW